MTRFSKKARDLTQSLIRQVAGGGDTKAGGIIPQWTEIRRRGHETSRYYPTMFSKKARDLTQSLIRQVARGGDTKAGGIIPQWTEIRRRKHETSRYYPTMAREARSEPMGYPFRPDEDVRNLSGEFVTPPQYHIEKCVDFSSVHKHKYKS